MLFKNDIYIDGDVRYRLLHADARSNVAWVISLDDPKAWPTQTSWRTLSQLLPMSASENQVGEQSSAGTRGPSSASRKVTPSMRKSRDKAIELLGEIQNRVPEVFDPALRGQLVREREQQGHSRSAIYKNLRRYWVGGQTPAALLGNFNQCGRAEGGVTAGRGAKSGFEHGTYQLTESDSKAFNDIIKRLYLNDGRLKITDAFQRLLEEHYQTADGNGKLWVRPQGERPSLRQFDYFLRKTYSLELRLRKREGDKDFERDHRAILDTVLSRCQGVGHQYEADATIADVYLVAKDDRRKIVGKPTLYFIIDRKSRLIVGWYVGLENSSWICAMQALLTVSMDKRTLCERYGVKYEPTDWPAHQVHSSELIADREMLQKSSDQIADDLATRVVNLPSQRPDHKPIVETQFKLTRMRLQDGTPGFDPPENAKRRMGKHYEKDACLTLDEFTAIILSAIIEHNRAPMKEYELSLTEIADEIEPSPIGIWNHNIVTRAGSLTKYPEERVRLALLPRGEATVSENGIDFGGCYYTCPEAINRGWFTQARKRRFKVEVSYDGRLVDTVYVRNTDKAGKHSEVYACVLTPRSQKFQGLSFAEVKACQFFRDLMTPAIDQGRIQARADFHGATKPIIDGALEKLKKAGPKKSRTARKADIKGDRMDELRKERQEVAAMPSGHATGKEKQPDAPKGHSTAQPTSPTQPVNQSGASTSAIGRVVSLQAVRAGLNTGTPEVPPASPGSPAKTTLAEAPVALSAASPASAPLSLEDKARLMRERMRNG